MTVVVFLERDLATAVGKQFVCMGAVWLSIDFNNKLLVGLGM